MAAANVALFHGPRRRLAGLPDCPGRNNRLRPRASGTSRSLIKLRRVGTHFVFIYEIWHCVNGNQLRSAPAML
jgi:hypothetical protein